MIILIYTYLLTINLFYTYYINKYIMHTSIKTGFSNIVLQEKYETIENRDADENTNLLNEDIN